MGSKARRKSKPARRHHTSSDPDPQPPLSESLDRDAAGVAAAEADHGSTEVELDLAAVAIHPPPAEGVETLTTLDTARAIASEDVPTVQHEPPMALDEARRQLERLFITMLAAGVSPRRALSASGSGKQAELQEHLATLGGSDGIELLAIQRRALAVVGGTESEDEQINAAPVMELASAATFRVEMVEFQIRQAILDRASSKMRGKIDVQRELAKVASSLPTDIPTISANEFDTIVEEKLGFSIGSSLLAEVVFARIIGKPFSHHIPKHLACGRDEFFAALAVFVADKPLSIDSVEGQLRHLVTTHGDLRASFRALDADGSGAISLDEFVTFLEREAHMHYPRDVLTAFIQRFDVDGDGTLSYDEFVAFVSPKHFGIQVLTPFGMFYQAADRHELMGDIVAKIRTRMFWMQHNDLFATSTLPVDKQPLKLKVTDHFILTHHYGTLRLQYKPSEPIGKVLKNGEMVVLFLEPGRTKTIGDRLPEFEYRLKPNVKRTIPPLLSWSLREPAQAQAPQTPFGTTKSSYTRSRRSLQSIATSRTAPPSIHDDTKSVDSTKTDMSGPRSSVTLTSSRAAHASRPAGRSTRLGSMPTSKPRPRVESSRPLVTVQESRNTELKWTQKVPLETQLKPSTVSSMKAAADEHATVSARSPVASSSGYEYYEPTENDEYEPDDDGSDEHSTNDAHDDDEDDFQDTAGGDQSVCPGFCVEDPTVDADEEPPPPAYDDG